MCKMKQVKKVRQLLQRQLKEMNQHQQKRSRMIQSGLEITRKKLPVNLFLPLTWYDQAIHYTKLAC